MQELKCQQQMQKQSHPYNLIAVHDEKGCILITNGTQKGKHSKPIHSTKYNQSLHSASVREIQKQKKNPQRARINQKKSKIKKWETAEMVQIYSNSQHVACARTLLEPPTALQYTFDFLFFL